MTAKLRTKQSRYLAGNRAFKVLIDRLAADAPRRAEDREGADSATLPPSLGYGHPDDFLEKMSLAAEVFERHAEQRYREIQNLLNPSGEQVGIAGGYLTIGQALLGTTKRWDFDDVSRNETEDWKRRAGNTMPTAQAARGFSKLLGERADLLSFLSNAQCAVRRGTFGTDESVRQCVERIAEVNRSLEAIMPIADLRAVLCDANRYLGRARAIQDINEEIRKALSGIHPKRFREAVRGGEPRPQAIRAEALLEQLEHPNLRDNIEEAFADRGAESEIRNTLEYIAENYVPESEQGVLGAVLLISIVPVFGFLFMLATGGWRDAWWAMPFAMLPIGIWGLLRFIENCVLRPIRRDIEKATERIIREIRPGRASAPWSHDLLEAGEARAQNSAARGAAQGNES